MAVIVRTSKQFGVDVILDDKETQEMLQRMIDLGHNLGPLLKKVQVYMMGSISKNFRAEGRPRRWASLSKRTVAMRRKGARGQGVAGGRPQILRDKGILMASVTARSARGAVRTITRDAMILGTRLAYAAAMQLGKAGRTVRQKVKAHKRGPYTRQANLFLGFAHPVAVRAHRVRAHVRTVRFGPTPARPFLMFQDEDVEQIRHMVADELVKAAEG